MNSSHVFNFEDLQEQAESYLESVRKKAREILENVAIDVQKQREQIRSEAETVREKAQQVGYQEGLQRGTVEAEKKIKAEVETQLQKKIDEATVTAQYDLKNLLQQCVNLREEVIRNWENAFLRLVCRVAKTVIRRELQCEPHISVQWIREALELSLGENALVLSLNPDDVTLLKMPLERLWGEFRLIGRVEVHADSTLSRGDCILRFENGQLDQRLDSQLARIEEELRQ